jgi:hypothetical protein
MTWQNQPGAQSPWQPGPQFPAQPSPQLPWQPGPQFPTPSPAPAGGYPGLPSPGQAAQPIPPAVFQAAEFAGLGAPTRGYNKGAANSSLTSTFGGVGGLIGIIGGGLGLLVGIVVPLIVAPFPWNLVTVGIILLVLLPFAWFFRGLFRGSGGGALRFWSCPNGLVYMRGSQISAIRWEQLGLIFRKTAFVNGQMSIIGYSVQPIGAPPFEFSVLGGAFGNMANMAAGRSGMSIETGAGVVSNYGGMVQIQGLVDASAYAGLGALIEEHLLAHQLPLVRQTYQQGQTVAFGQLLVHQRGLSDGTDVVSWEEYASAVVADAGYIQVFKKPGNQPAFQVSGLPNVVVLMSLIKEIRDQQRGHSTS